VIIYPDVKVVRTLTRDEWAALPRREKRELEPRARRRPGQPFVDVFNEIPDWYALYHPETMVIAVRRDLHPVRRWLARALLRLVAVVASGIRPDVNAALEILNAEMRGGRRMELP
jgi:hypothetical protein